MLNIKTTNGYYMYVDLKKNSICFYFGFDLGNIFRWSRHLKDGYFFIVKRKKKLQFEPWTPYSKIFWLKYRSRCKKKTVFSLDEQSFFHPSGLAELYYIIFSVKSKKLKKTLWIKNRNHCHLNHTIDTKKTKKVFHSSSFFFRKELPLHALAETRTENSSWSAVTILDITMFRL